MVVVDNGLIMSERRALGSRKDHSATRAAAPPPNARLFFVGAGVGDSGLRIKTIYTKHVYILTYR